MLGFGDNRGDFGASRCVPLRVRYRLPTRMSEADTAAAPPSTAIPLEGVTPGIPVNVIAYGFIALLLFVCH